MNFMIPLGAIAGGVFQGLALTREQQAQERQRKQQEFTNALDVLTHVMTSSNVTPEVLEYTSKLLGPVFQKQGVSLPQIPQIKPKALQDFENMAKVIEKGREEVKAGRMTQDEFNALLGIKHDPTREKTMLVPFGDQMYEVRVSDADIFRQGAANLRQQERLAAHGGGGGRRGGYSGGRSEGKLKSVSGLAAEGLREIKEILAQGDTERAQALLDEYNALAEQQRMPQFVIEQKKIGGKDAFFLHPIGSKGAESTKTKGAESTKKIRPDEQAKKQGLNLVPLEGPLLK
jgi:hypothetical protein